MIERLGALSLNPTPAQPRQPNTTSKLNTSQHPPNSTFTITIPTRPIRAAYATIMSTPSGGYGGGGYGGWIPPQTPTRMHTPIDVYNSGPPAQHHQYNNNNNNNNYQWPGAIPNTAPPGMRHPQHHHQHHPGSHRPIAHSPVPRQQHIPVGPDMPTVLLSLADTYISAAHTSGYKTAVGTAADAGAYYKLVSTGLGCLEAALQVCALC